MIYKNDYPNSEDKMGCANVNAHNLNRKLILAVLILFTVLHCSNRASYADNRPEEKQIHTERGQSEQEERLPAISQCVVCKVLNNGNRTKIPLHLQYERDMSRGDLTADGYLFFMGLGQYMELVNPRIPEFKFRDDFSIETVVDPSADKGSQRTKIYVQDDQNKYSLLEDLNEWSELPEGKYLIDVTCHVSRGEEYFCGDALLWLIIEIEDE